MRCRIFCYAYNGVQPIVEEAWVERFGRDEPLPSGMQGYWHDAEDAKAELIIDGGEISYLGRTISYDYKVIETDDGALTVSLKIDNEAEEDDFQRASLTEFVITPEGDLHAYNVRFASQFVRGSS
ncbi:hypothetical protein [Sphingomonas sanguinis]|uniref:hypothetical protein n=1 Tax=Sphingomonas sanguinis TaxID=33051 RepID=UPI0030162220